MVRGQTYLKSIGDMNDVLRIIPKAYLFERAIEMMGGNNRDWCIHRKGSPDKSLYDINLKQWEISAINSMIQTLLKIGYVKGDRLSPTDQIHDASEAAMRLERTYADLIKRKFKSNPLLASYIKCHLVNDNDETDRFTTSMTDILEEYPTKYSADVVKNDIGDGLLNLIIEVFDGKLDLRMFSDDIVIKLGFKNPLPIWVEPYGDFINNKVVSQEEIEDMFLKCHVIYL